MAEPGVKRLKSSPIVIDYTCKSVELCRESWAVIKNACVYEVEGDNNIILKADPLDYLTSLKQKQDVKVLIKPTGAPPVLIITDRVYENTKKLLAKMSGDEQPLFGHTAYGLPGIGKSTITRILAACLCRKDKTIVATMKSNQDITTQDARESLISFLDSHCHENKYVIIDQMNYMMLGGDKAIEFFDCLERTSSTILFMSSGHRPPQEVIRRSGPITFELLEHAITANEVEKLFKIKNLILAEDAIYSKIAEQLTSFRAIVETILKLRLGPKIEKELLERLPPTQFYFRIMGKLELTSPNEVYSSELRVLCLTLDLLWKLPVAKLKLVEQDLFRYTLTVHDMMVLIRGKVAKDKADKNPVNIFFAYLQAICTPLVSGDLNLSFKLQNLHALQHVIDTVHSFFGMKTIPGHIKEQWEFAYNMFAGTEPGIVKGHAFQKLCKLACTSTLGYTRSNSNESYALTLDKDDKFPLQCSVKPVNCALELHDTKVTNQSSELCSLYTCKESCKEFGKNGTHEFSCFVNLDASPDHHFRGYDFAYICAWHIVNDQQKAAKLIRMELIQCTTNPEDKVKNLEDKDKSMSTMYKSIVDCLARQEKDSQDEICKKVVPWILHPAYVTFERELKMPVAFDTKIREIEVLSRSFNVEELKRKLEHCSH